MTPQTGSGNGSIPPWITGPISNLTGAVTTVIGQSASIIGQNAQNTFGQLGIVGEVLAGIGVQSLNDAITRFFLFIFGIIFILIGIHNL